ncbi:histidine phosphatase family protein [Candidatus Woesearchaeota archaeon]|nr:histidine phosphatase family protein [Candidatus Woesearchaeota archaeon]
MKLYFIRHAQRGYGEEQDTLTEEGVEQAQKLAKYLCKFEIDKIICSSLNRTRKTVEPTLAILHVPVEFTDEVIEQKNGILQGRTAEEYRTALRESGLTKEEFRPEGGENESDAYHRAERFVQKLKKQKEQNILIISHAGFISNIVVILLKKSKEERKNYKSDFCALTYFELDDHFNVLDYRTNQKTIS